MEKSAKHRKRHMPPGPCGIWFQTQQQQVNNNHTPGNSHGSSTKRTPSSSMITHESSWDHHQHHQQPSPEKSPKQHDTCGGNDMSFSPAWTCMQQELNILTPFLPPHFTPAQRYRQLRPHMSDYALLWEFQRGDFDATFSGATSDTASSILVLVSNVESHIHHNIWTVEFKDECGVVVKAWLEPTLVQQQLQQSNDSSIIRPGVVWKLRLANIGMIVINPTVTNDDLDDEERLERMLLIRASAIAQVWTPEQSQRQHADDDNDTPRRQEEFLEWMERRKALPLVTEEDEEHGHVNPNGSGDDDEDEEDMGPPPEDLEENFIAASATSRHPQPAPYDENSEEDEGRFEPRLHFSASLWNTKTGLPSSSSHPEDANPLQSQTTRSTANRPTTQDPCVQPLWTRRSNANTNDTTNTDAAERTREITIHRQQDITPTPLTATQSVLNTQQQMLDTNPPSVTKNRHEEIQDESSDNENDVLETATPPLGSTQTANPMVDGSAWIASSQNSSSLWNAMLDDDDDDESNHCDNEAPITAPATAHMDSSSARNEAKSSTNCQDNDDNDDDEPHTQDENYGGLFAEESTSMFASSCIVGNIDLAAFSDDDDDDE